MIQINDLILDLGYIKDKKRTEWIKKKEIFKPSQKQSLNRYIKDKKRTECINSYKQQKNENGIDIIL